MVVAVDSFIFAREVVGGGVEVGRVIGGGDVGGGVVGGGVVGCGGVMMISDGQVEPLA